MRKKYRFIPTGVGNIGPGKFDRAGLAVHPHGCGEHTKTEVLFFAVHGSSPRVWGTCISGANRPALYRFIPTGVGNMRRSTPAG